MNERDDDVKVVELVVELEGLRTKFAENCSSMRNDILEMSRDFDLLINVVLKVSTDTALLVKQNDQLAECLKALYERAAELGFGWLPECNQARNLLRKKS